MFEESLVESTGLLGRRASWPTIVSVCIQAALAAVLLAVPLVHPELLPLHAPALSLVAPPPKPPQPPTSHRTEPVHVDQTNNLLAAAPPAPVMARPVLGSHPLSPGINSDDAPSTAAISIGGDGPVVPLAFTSGAPSTPVVRAGASASGKPARISLGVSSGLLLEPIRPVYPAIARAAGIGGTVVVQAIISKQGRVESAHIVSGPPMLQAAALEAVERARYRPYLLNNEPTEVDTTFSIIFHLGGGS